MNFRSYVAGIAALAMVGFASLSSADAGLFGNHCCRSKCCNNSAVWGACAPSCNTCDTGCNRGCGGGLLAKLFGGCNRSSCCAAEPSCGCEPACGAPAACEPVCGAPAEPACGCEPVCGAPAEPACGCEPACGAPAPSCCNSSCCAPRKRCRGLLSRLLHKCKRSSCCNTAPSCGCEPACGAPAPCEPVCGAPAPCEPTCGCS